MGKMSKNKKKMKRRPRLALVMNTDQDPVLVCLGYKTIMSQPSRPHMHTPDRRTPTSTESMLSAGCHPCVHK